MSRSRFARTTGAFLLRVCDGNPRNYRATDDSIGAIGRFSSVVEWVYGNHSSNFHGPAKRRSDRISIKRWIRKYGCKCIISAIWNWDRWLCGKRPARWDYWRWSRHRDRRDAFSYAKSRSRDADTDQKKGSRPTASAIYSLSTGTAAANGKSVFASGRTCTKDMSTHYLLKDL